MCVLLDMMDQQKKVRFSKSEKFKVEAFLPILDILISEMTKRAEAYSQIEKNILFLHWIENNCFWYTKEK